MKALNVIARLHSRNLVSRAPQYLERMRHLHRGVPIAMITEDSYSGSLDVGEKIGDDSVLATLVILIVRGAGVTRSTSEHSGYIAMLCGSFREAPSHVNIDI